MQSTEGMWVPSYYRRRHPFLWVRAAGGPQRVDWIVGLVLAMLVFGLFALARAPQHQPAANPDRVAFVSQPAAASK